MKSRPPRGCYPGRFRKPLPASARACWRSGAAALPALGFVGPGFALAVQPDRAGWPIPVLRQRRYPRTWRCHSSGAEGRRHESETAARIRHEKGRIRLRARLRTYGYTSAAKIPDRWVSDDLRLLLGRVRHADRRPRRQGGSSARKRGPSRQSRQALSEGAGRTPHPRRRKPGPIPAAKESARASSSGSAGTRRSRLWCGSSARPSQPLPVRAALGVVSTGQLVTEEFYTLGKLVQLGFGTNNYDGNTTLCMASAVAGYKRSFGSDGPPGRVRGLSSGRMWSS